MSDESKEKLKAIKWSELFSSASKKKKKKKTKQDLSKYHPSVRHLVEQPSGD